MDNIVRGVDRKRTSIRKLKKINPRNGYNGVNCDVRILRSNMASSGCESPTAISPQSSTSELEFSDNSASLSEEEELAAESQVRL